MILSPGAKLAPLALLALFAPLSPGALAQDDGGSEEVDSGDHNYNYEEPNPILPGYQCIWYGNAGLDPEADPVTEPHRILPEVDDKPGRPATQEQVCGGGGGGEGSGGGAPQSKSRVAKPSRKGKGNLRKTDLPKWGIFPAKY